MKTVIDSIAGVINVTCGVAIPKQGLKFDAEWGFDFSDVPADDIIKLATKTVVIMQQGAFRKLPKDQRDAFLSQTFDVQTLLTTKQERVKKDPKVAALELLAGMTTDEREEFLAQI